MRRIRDLSFDEIIEYNLREGGTEFTVFEETQLDRVNKARELVARCLDIVDAQNGWVGGRNIVELGCSAGDILGVFSQVHECYGYDVTPGAVKAARERYPNLTVIKAAVENVEPHACDVLILCEFLEHIVDPCGLVEAWMPLAKTVVIGHPLLREGEVDPEYGHLWSYTNEDFEAWFPMGGHVLDEAYTFDMGYHMVIGRGHRAT
jgi:hypothetical protein